ncbi:unnamed protein product [Jaminaea pallidilutea]
MDPVKSYDSFMEERQEWDQHWQTTLEQSDIEDITEETKPAETSGTSGASSSRGTHQDRTTSTKPARKPYTRQFTGPLADIAATSAKFRKAMWKTTGGRHGQAEVLVLRPFHGSRPQLLLPRRCGASSLAPREGHQRRRDEAGTAQSL